MGGLFSFIGLLLTPRFQDKGEEKVVTKFEDREEMKLTQLESYLMADENKGIANLALYL